MSPVRTWLAGFALWHALVSAQAGSSPPLAAGDIALEPSIVAITVNGAARGDFFVHRTPAGRIVLRRQDLPALGLSLMPATSAVIDGIEHVALDGVDGLSLRSDETALTLSLTAEPRLLARHVVASSSRPARADRWAAEGGFLNWALERTQGDTAPPAAANLALEAGVRLGPGLILHRTRTLADAQGGQRLVRVSSAWTLDQPERLTRWTVGDLVALSDELGQGMLLGGVSLSTLARLDPYRIRYPLGAVQGQALMPSEVEVYVDGQRVRTERVPAGVFEIRDLAAPLGARSVQLLVRDPYGRVQRYDQSLYVSQRLLAPGLYDFEYAAGGMRRDTGQDNPRYGPAAFSARHAWGASPALTLGLRAQARAGQFTGGGSMLVRAADRGLLSFSIATSRTGHVGGHAGLVRHDYQSPQWGLGLGLRVDSPGYASLGAAPAAGNLRREVQVHASRALSEGRSVWVSHSRQDLHSAQRSVAPSGWPLAPAEPRRQTFFGYTAWLRPWGASLRLSAGRLSQGQATRHEASVSLMFLLGGGSVLFTQSRWGLDGPTQSAQWSQPVPFQGGWGHDLSASRQAAPAGEAVRWRVANHLEADALRLRADWSGGPGQGQGALRLSAAGALSYLGGQWHISRPVDDSYALVQVDGMAGVPVTVNGLPVGVTDPRGQRLVTQVGAHHEAVFEIDPRAIPIDHKLTRLQHRVTLPERGGAVIRFEVQPLRALVAQLFMPSGQERLLLPLARIHIGTGPQALETVTGLHGELYLENLAPGLHEGQAQGEPGLCHFRLAVPHTREVMTDLGMVACTPHAPNQNRSEGPR